MSRARLNFVTICLFVVAIRFSFQIIYGHIADTLITITTNLMHYILYNNTDAYLLSMDVCTIVKGCVFEWKLNDGIVDLHNTFVRILHCYFAGIMK